MADSNGGVMTSPLSKQQRMYFLNNVISKRINYDKISFNKSKRRNVKIHFR